MPEGLSAAEVGKEIAEHREQLNTLNTPRTPNTPSTPPIATPVVTD